MALAACLSPALADVQPVNPQDYLEHIKILASPEMEGRGPGTKGIERAEQYIERQFKQFGLRPAGQQSSWLQPFSVTTGSRLKGENRLTVRNGKAPQSLALDKQYSPISFSASGTVNAPLVFVGYGITATDYHYDDYANVDVKGKVVLVLRYEPKSFEQQSGHQGVTRYAAVFSKAINAREHGATAMILINGQLPNGREDKLIPFGRLAGPEDIGIPLVQVANAVAEDWVKSAGKSLPELQQQIDSSTQPNAFALPESLQVSLAVNVEHMRANVANVIGYLPGKTDEYIVIGAHYDHLGYGDSHSLAPSQVGQIHFGADDNASGTAGVLELARIFSQRAKQGEQLKRGILFITFAGEELGLLGSADWVNHPTLPLDKDVAMINMDMIGRLRDNKLYVGGVGSSAEFRSMVEQAAGKDGFQVDYSFRGSSASDHTSFLSKKIPVLFFFSGLHSDYHKPSDTWDKINAQGGAQIVALVEQLASEIANADSAPKFVAPAEMASAHAEGDVSSGDVGYGPYFGSVPDFGEQTDGVKFADIHADSPAGKAGLKAGDVLVQFGDMAIHNLYDFTDALRRSHVGQTVEVKVLRNGQPVTAKVTLEQRR
jgi:hypothetical protein